MVCLVTGARGLLGRHLVAALRRSTDWDVLGIVRAEPENDAELQCELSDATAVARLLTETQPDRIFHLAGSFSNVFDVDLRNNVLAAGNVLGWVAERKRDTRVVATGSAAEYGPVERASNPVSETHATRPHTVYGVTKLLQSHLTSFYWRTFRVQAMVGRVFNLLGPGASERLFVGSVEQQVRRVRDNSIECIEVGNLDGIRDYLSPAAAADALITVMSFGVPGEIYNVGSGVPVRVRDVLHSMLAQAGVPDCCVRERPAHAERSRDVSVIYADVSKLRSLQASASSASRCCP